MASIAERLQQSRSQPAPGRCPCMCDCLTAGFLVWGNCCTDAALSQRESGCPPCAQPVIQRNRRLHTSILNNQRHPCWGETFRLLVMDAQQDVLRCLLYDYDTFFADSLLGTCARGAFPCVKILFQR